jgi:hypothetical protein
MILDAVLADRSVNWPGSEREKRRYFKQRLGDNLRDNGYPRLVFGKPPDLTIRYFPDKIPIGYEPNRRRHVFLYLARSPSPIDFRVFILRHLELLNAFGLLTPQVSARRSRRCWRRCFPAAAEASQPESDTRDRSIFGLRAANNADARGHHVDEHRAVLSAVQASARCAAHARSPRVAFGP